jgi:hypothetical protein
LRAIERLADLIIKVRVSIIEVSAEIAVLLLISIISVEVVGGIPKYLIIRIMSIREGRRVNTKVVAVPLTNLIIGAVIGKTI